MAARNALLGVSLSMIAVWAVAEGSPIPVLESGAPAAAQQPVQSVAPQGAALQSAAVAQPGMLLNQLETLQREVMELRGLAEEQANVIERIQKENRDRYLDLDRRIAQLSTRIDGSKASAIATDSNLPQAAVAPVSPAVDAASAKQVLDTGNELYQKTFQKIRERKFDEALAGLKHYLGSYPKGPFADNAQYWLGEVYLAQGQLEKSRIAFQTLTQNHPFSDKLADAIYKLGQVYDRLGDQARAREYLERAMKKFPNSSAARLADVYLQGLGGQ